MRNERRQPSPRTRPGESMVAVAVMLLVFFTIGASILTAAAGTTAAATARVSQRQAYYDTRSLLILLDGELRTGTGALYDVLCEDALRQVETAYAADGGLEEMDLKNGSVVMELGFSGDGTADGSLREDLVFEKPTLTYAGKAVVLNTRTNNGIVELSEIAVRLNKVRLTVRGVYREDYSSSVTVDYRFNGFGRRDAATNTWKWSGSWVIERVS